VILEMALDADQERKFVELKDIPGLPVGSNIDLNVDIDHAENLNIDIDNVLGAQDPIPERLRAENFKKTWKSLGLDAGKPEVREKYEQAKNENGENFVNGVYKSFNLKEGMGGIPVRESQEKSRHQKQMSIVIEGEELPPVEFEEKERNESNIENEISSQIRRLMLYTPGRSEESSAYTGSTYTGSTYSRARSAQTSQYSESSYSCSTSELFEDEKNFYVPKKDIQFGVPHPKTCPIRLEVTGSVTKELNGTYMRQSYHDENFYYKSKTNQCVIRWYPSKRFWLFDARGLNSDDIAAAVAKQNVIHPGLVTEPWLFYDGVKRKCWLVDRKLKIGYFFEGD